MPRRHPIISRYYPDQPDVLDLGGRMKELHSPYIAEWWEEEYGCWLRITVPAGFVYNGASVPQAVWSIYPPHALDRAAVFHDFIYRTAGLLPEGSQEYQYEGQEWRPYSTPWTRNSADTLFFKHLDEDPNGPGWFSRQAAYRVVRIFGGSRWG